MFLYWGGDITHSQIKGFIKPLEQKYLCLKWDIDSLASNDNFFYLVNLHNSRMYTA